MKKLLAFLVMPLLFTACDGGDNNFDCTLLSDFPQTDCLAEDLSDLCVGFICDTEPPTSELALFQSCSAVDCSTLDCGNTVFTELDMSGDGTITSDVFVDNQDLGVAECGFFQR